MATGHHLDGYNHLRNLRCLYQVHQNLGQMRPHLIHGKQCQSHHPHKLLHNFAGRLLNPDCHLCEYWHHVS